MAVAFVVAPEEISGPILRMDSCEQYAAIQAPPVAAPVAPAPVQIPVQAPVTVDNVRTVDVSMPVVIFVIVISLISIGGLIVWRVCANMDDGKGPRMTPLDVNGTYADTKSIELDNMASPRV
jgi:hypothetical protein